MLPSTSGDQINQPDGAQPEQPDKRKGERRDVMGCPLLSAARANCVLQVDDCWLKTATGFVTCCTAIRNDGLSWDDLLLTTELCAKRRKKKKTDVRLKSQQLGDDRKWEGRDETKVLGCNQIRGLCFLCSFKHSDQEGSYLHIDIMEAAIYFPKNYVSFSKRFTILFT